MAVLAVSGCSGAADPVAAAEETELAVEEIATAEPTATIAPAATAVPSATPAPEPTATPEPVAFDYDAYRNYTTRPERKVMSDDELTAVFANPSYCSPVRELSDSLNGDAQNVAATKSGAWIKSLAKAQGLTAEHAAEGADMVFTYWCAEPTSSALAASGVEAFADLI